MDGRMLALWTAVALFGVMTPGLDTLLVLRYTLLYNRRDGFAAVAGIAAGYVVWATASLVGLTAILAASEFAYDLVRLAGAIYLAWLGCSIIWRSFHDGARSDLVDGSLSSPGRRAAVRTGAFTNLLNPKVGVFYLSVLPQFISNGSGYVAWGAILVAIHIAVTFGWFTLVIWGANKARNHLLRARTRAWIDRVSGTVLIGLGAKLVADVR